MARVALLGTLLLLAVSPAFAASAALTGLEISAYEGRELLVLRTSGGVAIPATFSRDKEAGLLRFALSAEAAASLDPQSMSGELIRRVELKSGPGETLVTLTLARPELADPACFRFSSPSRHLVLLEVFEAPPVREQAEPLRDIDEWLAAAAVSAAPVKTEAKPPSNQAAKPSPGLYSELQGISRLDLRQADPQRVLGLAADLGLLNLNGRASVSTERMGSISVKPGGQSLLGWSDKTPPSEIYLAGSPEQIAQFLQYSDPRFINSQPSLKQQWVAQRPQASSKPVLGGRSAATRSRVKDDPHGGLYYSDYQPGGLRLSDTLVTLDASNGLNLYDVLNYLSEISGVSLVIDPYTFDDPTGSRRDPLEPEPVDPNNGGEGFRPAGVFQPGLMRTGSVRGNFVNVPFDEFLHTILQTHDLAYAVQGAGGSSDSGYGGSQRPAGSGTGQRDPYQRPVILVTSRQRLEYELSGTNDISLTQFHYADPEQIRQIVNQFGMMPDSNSGWYIYRGNGGSLGLGRQGGGGNSGGNQGRGGNGGNQGGLNSGRPAVADIQVWRGGQSNAAAEAVASALAAGKSVVHIVLDTPDPGQQVTLFSQSGRAR